MFRIMHWFTSGLTIFKLAKTRRKGEIEVPMDTKTDFFGNSKNGGTKFEKVLLRVPILSVLWTGYREDLKTGTSLRVKVLLS